MSKIVPKLNLNKTPQLVENNSLVMAKNIRLLEDGTIGPDTSLEEIETNIGDATEHVIKHPQVVQTVTDYLYSILNYRDSINVYNGGTPDLDNNCFDFYTGDGPWNTNYRYSNLRFYRKINSEESAFIYCYKQNSPTSINWVSEKFKYDISKNRLIDEFNYVFLIAIRLEIISQSTVPLDGNPDFFYIIFPSNLINTDITFNGVTYKLLNPVYQSKKTYQKVIEEAWTERWKTYDTIEYISQIVGLNNKIYFFKENNFIKYSQDARNLIETEYSNETFVDSPISGRDITFDVNSDGYVTHNGVLFQDTSIARTLIPNRNDRIKIFEYDEVDNVFTIVKCAWKYSGGKSINGCVTVNGTGETVLTICESDFEDNKTIPIKHINISRCTEEDDESTYTQAPNIPITNLLYHSKYTQQIPAGVYQFFIRYEIRDNFYTNWFPCSTELSAAVKTSTNTIQGSLLHIDVHSDSSESFVLKVEHLYPEFTSNYIKFQIGFILSHDGGVFARSWKSFPIENSNNTLIYFDYNKEDIADINIDDLLKVNYDVFNVKNIASFKNKLYISNYIESDLNDNDPYLEDFAQNIRIEVDTKKIEGQSYYSLNDYILHSVEVSDVTYYTTYSDSNGTYNLGDTYADENWCNIDTSYTTSYHTFNYLIQDWEENSQGHYVPVNHQIPDNINNFIRVLSLYSLYIYDENNHRIDLITDNSSSATQDATPLDITKFRTNIMFPNNMCTNFIIRKLKSDEGVSSAFGIGTDNKYYIQYIHNGITKYIKADKIYYKAGYLQRLDDTQETNPTTHLPDIYANFKRHIYDSEISIESLYNIQHNSNIGVEDSQTLLPFTNYDFYCHFVKQNGIVTNGYKIKSIFIKKWGHYIIEERPNYVITEKPSNNNVLLNGEVFGYVKYEPLIQGGVTSRETVNSQAITSDYVVYPKFYTTRTIPSDYVGYFISMHKHKNNVCEIVSNIDGQTGPEYRFDCIEIDAQLHNILDRITIRNWKGELISNEGKYAPSGITEGTDISKFGDTGFVYFNNNSLSDLKNLWIIGNEYNSDNYKELIKVTPFIKKTITSYTKLENQFLQGYYCLISKLKHKQDGSRKYVSGSDIYTITIDASGTQNGITLQQDDAIQRIDYSTKYNIHSNYNLNYISLTQDINPQIRTYDVKEIRESSTNSQGVTEEVNVSTRKQQIIHSVDSLISSYILKLDSTYKDYTKKLFYVKDDNKKIKFDNTLRSSNIDVDEMYRYIYRFEATDYYNVPSNRGIITNLISIANTLYVHCEHSLFKFTDNKTIDAQDEQVVLQENDIFNSGISEVFDAQYGYAGLKNRTQSLITYNAYIFYDEVSQIIYAFGGEQQIGNISESIKKLIKVINPTDVQFVGDELNNRFFVNLKNNEGNVCLSFNFNAKSFVSIHDINFKYGFHSRRNTYFVHDNIYEGDITGWSIYKVVDYINEELITPAINYIAYQNCYKQSLIKISDCDDILLNPVKATNACVDIIINTEYEKIKQLDYISWVCSEILEYGDDENLIAEEVLNRKYPGTKLRIYSDSTKSDLFELLKSDGTAKISNEERNVNADDEPNPNPNSWQYPQYNCGVWSMNYFRDILNTGDIFHYKASKNKITGGSGHSETTNLTPKIQRENLTQESSLLYGKYFVLRFIFNNKNFKLENIIVKMNDYGKTK